MDIKKIFFKTADFDAEKALPDAVLYCKRDGKIQWITDKVTELFETPKMHLLTSNIKDFIENALNMVENAVLLKTEQIVKYNNQEIYFNMTVNELEGGYVIALRPVSLPQLPEQVSVCNKTSDEAEFFMKLSNDFKAPLQSNVGFSQAMLDGLGGNLTLQQEKYVKIINKNSNELMYFITKLMNFLQSEKQSEQVELKIFNIQNTINSVIKFNEHLFKEKDIKWIYNIQENAKATICTNEEIVKNILQNLIEVVLRVVDMGSVEVELSVPTETWLASKNIAGSYVQISVKSSSMLLSENETEYMFEPYRIIDTQNRKNLLRSIILAYIRNKIKLLNGRIWVDTEILKKTSLNIILPVGNV